MANAQNLSLTLIVIVFIASIEFATCRPVEETHDGSTEASSTTTTSKLLTVVHGSNDSKVKDTAATAGQDINTTEKPVTEKAVETSSGSSSSTTTTTPKPQSDADGHRKGRQQCFGYKGMC